MNVGRRLTDVVHSVNPTFQVRWVIRSDSEQLPRDKRRMLLKTQQKKSLEKIHEILKAREKESQHRGGGHLGDTKGTYAIQKKNDKKCYICGQSDHPAKVCWHRKNHKEKNYKATSSNKDGRTLT